MTTRDTRDENLLCWLLNDYHDDNPFTDCLERLGPHMVEGLYQSCLIDVTKTENEFDQWDVVCDTLKPLTRECMALGIYVDTTWTDLTACRKSEILISLVSKGHSNTTLQSDKLNPFIPRE